MILHHDFITVAQQNGPKIAIIDRTTDKRVPYSRALLISLLFAGRLRKNKDTFIGVMAPTSAGAYLAVIGLLMAGKVPVMLNYSTGAEQNCQYAQDLCGFKTILTSKALLEKIKCPLLPGMVCLEDLADSFSGPEKLQALALSKLPAKLLMRLLPKVTADDTAAILFTSGSENEPKAVQLSHTNIASNVQSIIAHYGLHRDDIVFNAMPLFHVFGLTPGFWVPLLLQGTVVTCANPLEFKNIPRYIREEKATLVPGTPTFFAAYLREAQPGDFASVRLMVPGGDKSPEWLREAYREAHQIELLEGYGATETSPVIATNTLNASRAGSVGRVVPGAKVQIVDVDTGQPLPTGQVGKVLVKGNLVMKGYFDDLEATSLHIRDGWYDTGDMGRFDEDGFLWLAGRLKRFVKIGGEMVSLGRVETVLGELLPKGVDCCVVELPDAHKGARLVVVTTQPVAKSDFIKGMGKTLPPIAVPKTFLVMPDLPKMANGKVDFRTVTKLAREQLSN